MRLLLIVTVSAHAFLTLGCSSSETPASGSANGEDERMENGENNEELIEGEVGGSTGVNEDPPDADGVIGRECSADASFEQFRGYALSELNLVSNDPACDGNPCLVNHVQGRLDCPYGQSEETLSLPEDDPSRCQTSEGLPVQVAVEPQLVERRVEDHVYCSCRCAGPDPEDEYCECPSGFECEELVEDLGLGATDFAGSYCIFAGSAFDAGQPPIQECDAALNNCD